MFITWRRGVSITEAAIVMAIVGLVLAGIWAAYSNAMLNYQTNLLSRDVNYILAEFEVSGFGVSNFSATAACHSGSCINPGTSQAIPGSTCYFGMSGASMDLPAAQQGVVPPDMFSNPLSYVPLYNPWGTTFQITFETDGSNCSASTPTAAGGTSNRLSLDLGSIPSAACTRLLTNNVNGWIHSGLNQICTGGCSAINAYFDTVADAQTMLTASNIAAWCSMTDPTDLKVEFAWPLR
jgi:hypothetical protein